MLIASTRALDRLCAIAARCKRREATSPVPRDPFIEQIHRGLGGLARLIPDLAADLVLKSDLHVVHTHALQAQQPTPVIPFFRTRRLSAPLGSGRQEARTIGAARRAP